MERAFVFHQCDLRFIPAGIICGFSCSWFSLCSGWRRGGFRFFSPVFLSAQKPKTRVKPAKTDVVFSLNILINKLICLFVYLFIYLCYRVLYLLNYIAINSQNGCTVVLCETFERPSVVFRINQLDQQQASGLSHIGLFSSGMAFQKV